MDKLDRPKLNDTVRFYGRCASVVQLDPDRTWLYRAGRTWSVRNDQLSRKGKGWVLDCRSVSA